MGRLTSHEIWSLITTDSKEKYWYPWDGTLAVQPPTRGPLKGDMTYPINTYYRRCIWDLFLRVLSHWYHHFPYDYGFSSRFPKKTWRNPTILRVYPLDWWGFGCAFVRALPSLESSRPTFRISRGNMGSFPVTLARVAPYSQDILYIYEDKDVYIHIIYTFIQFLFNLYIRCYYIYFVF